jgi:hypothetical protein
MRLLLEGDVAQGLAQLSLGVPLDDESRSSRVLFPDGEATYLAARLWARGGAHAQAVKALRLAVAQGFACAAGFRRDPWLAPLSGDPAFEAVTAQADAGHAEARRVFIEHNGPALLGVADSDSWQASAGGQTGSDLASGRVHDSAQPPSRLRSTGVE